MHVLEPFLLDLRLTPDHSLSDIEAECKHLMARQRLISGFLKGTVSYEELEDALADGGTDPYEYWQIVDENIDAIVQQETVLEHVEILLPPGYSYVQ